MNRQSLVHLFIVLLLLPGCSLLKNSKTETEKNQQSATSSNQRKLDATLNVSTDKRIFKWTLDSSGYQSILQIWPKGLFTFSFDKGFEGNAEKIQLSTTARKSDVSLQLKDSVVNAATQINTESTHKTENQQQNTNTVKTKTPASWLIMGLAALLMVGIMVYRLLKLK